MSECCKYYQEGIDKLNAPIVVASARAGKDLYSGKPFNYCPWCGTKIRVVDPKLWDAFLVLKKYCEKAMRT